MFSIKSFKDSFLSLQDSSWIIEILNRITLIIMDNVFNNVRFGRNIIVIINFLIIIYETTFSFKRSMFDIVAIFINFTLLLFLLLLLFDYHLWDHFQFHQFHSRPLPDFHLLFLLLLLCDLQNWTISVFAEVIGGPLWRMGDILLCFGYLWASNLFNKNIWRIFNNRLRIFQVLLIY